MAIDWTIRSTPVPGANLVWSAICWGPSATMFVAVARAFSGDLIMTSPDGINWTSRTPPASIYFWDVCWSPELSLFVIVAGTGSVVMTSPDGINWTSRATVSKSWGCVCWSPELSLFAAAAYSSAANNVMTSPNGIDWTLRTSPQGRDWWGICWSPELTLFVAVANGGTGDWVMTSPDGITWTTRTSPKESWRSVCWSPSAAMFVAVASGHVMSSPDGINWTSRTPAASLGWGSVCWSPELSLFVAVANTGTGNRVMTSPDGITWTIGVSAADNQWIGVCWSPELLMFAAIATSGNGTRVMTGEPEFDEPGAITNAATLVAKPSATLNGTVTDDGGIACEYRFRYKKSGGSYSYTAWTGSKETDETFSEAISGLDSNSLYYFNAQVKNASYESEWGNEMYFVTLSPRDTVDVEDGITLEFIHRMEMAGGGKFYIDENGNACYRSRFARAG